MKHLVRNALKSSLPSRHPPVVVASMGRSGSTLIYRSLCSGMSTKRFGTDRFKAESLVREVVWRLDGAQLKNGLVYKTHDFPYALPNSDQIRVVFLFGSASDAARSVLRCDTTYGRDWIKDHFEHLGATGNIDEVHERDVLRFEEQLDSWLECESVPVMALRYEDLWTSGVDTVLSRFVGFPVTLPNRKLRESAGMDIGGLEGQLMETYARLDQKISALPAMIVNKKARALCGPLSTS